jgi:hypothetical protein
MIEIVINYDKDKKMFKVYESSSDTLMITSSLSESLLNLNKFLKDSNLINKDILQDDNITYHLDSGTMVAMVESNVNLMKRLRNSPSGFMTSSQKFGSSLGNNNKNNSSNSQEKPNKKGRRGTGMFSNTAFRNSYKKFGGLSNF